MVRQLAHLVKGIQKMYEIYRSLLVVEPTHLKKISQNGNLPQVGMNNKNIWNHHLEYGCSCPKNQPESQVTGGLEIQSNPAI